AQAKGEWRGRPARRRLTGWLFNTTLPESCIVTRMGRRIMANGRRERLVIIGSGPAAWTAAVYAARAKLEPIVYEGEPTRDMIPGGQLMWTTEVDNYPGFPEGVGGQELMDRMKAQALRFGTRAEMENITELDLSRRP